MVSDARLTLRPTLRGQSGDLSCDSKRASGKQAKTFRIAGRSELSSDALDNEHRALDARASHLDASEWRKERLPSSSKVCGQACRSSRSALTMRGRRCRHRGQSCPAAPRKRCPCRRSPRMTLPPRDAMSWT
eukprot:2475317-Prymnesium_polylepis.2